MRVCVCACACVRGIALTNVAVEISIGVCKWYALSDAKEEVRRMNNQDLFRSATDSR